MRRLTAILLAAVVGMAATCVAVADSSSVGVTITSNREPENLSIPSNLKYQFNAGHTFDSGVILGGSFEYTDTAFSDRTSQNLEGTVGYRFPLNYASSLTGSAGVGERWRQNPNTSFPYFVLRIGYDFGLTQDITWNVISYRFRDAFDSDVGYHTPHIATGLTFKLDAHSLITAKISYNWHEDAPSSTGISFGFKKEF